MVFLAIRQHLDQLDNFDVCVVVVYVVAAAVGKLLLGMLVNVTNVFSM